MTEQQLIEKAGRDGDQQAYGELVEPYRGELHAHCYRMLGSTHDADDALQEALLRAWRGLDRFEGRSSLKSWLYRIATNVCLRLIERRPQRILPIDDPPGTDPHGPLSDPVDDTPWLEPYPGLPESGLAAPEARYERRESVELAFVAALQHLPARQRAVLILRDVLGFSGEEVAAQLETTPASVYSALQRAHRTVDERLPARTQQAALGALGDERLRRLVAAYADAWERGDVGAVVAMLAQDASIAMPPYSEWYAGRADVAAFLADTPLGGDKRWRVMQAPANAQAGLAYYLWDDAAGAYMAHGINVLTLDGDRVAAIMAFIEPALFEPFGLPDHLAA
jgi:RNA polymerase sigma-70 factor, ECF subfamily